MGRPRCSLDRIGESAKPGDRRSLDPSALALSHVHRGQPSTPARGGEEDEMKLRFCRLLFLAIPLFSSISTPAQEPGPAGGASIHGTVTDPSGAAIGGAIVTAAPLDTAAKPVIEHSGPNGAFSVEVPPGHYRVTISYPSFASEVRDFVLVVGETKTWDARLELQTASANVVVTGA